MNDVKIALYLLQKNSKSVVIYIFFAFVAYLSHFYDFSEKYRLLFVILAFLLVIFMRKFSNKNRL